MTTPSERAAMLYTGTKMKAITMMRDWLALIDIKEIAAIHEEMYTGATENAESYAARIVEATQLTREDAILCVQQAVLMHCTAMYLAPLKSGRGQ
jgi:hypothetical protein